MGQIPPPILSATEGEGGEALPQVKMAATVMACQGVAVDLVIEPGNGIGAPGGLDVAPAIGPKGGAEFRVAGQESGPEGKIAFPAGGVPQASAPVPRDLAIGGDIGGEQRPSARKGRDGKRVRTVARRAGNYKRAAGQGAVAIGRVDQLDALGQAPIAGLLC